MKHSVIANASSVSSDSAAQQRTNAEMFTVDAKFEKVRTATIRHAAIGADIVVWRQKKWPMIDCATLSLSFPRKCCATRVPLVLVCSAIRVTFAFDDASEMLQKDQHIHTFTYTYTHTQSHTHTHIHIHTFVHTHVHTVI